MNTKVEAILYTLSQNITIEGRYIGLLTPEQFAAVLKYSKLQSKLFTSASQPLSDLKNTTDLNNKRLVIAVRLLDGKNTSKKLFISGRLKGVAAATINSLDVTAESDDWISLKEVEVKYGANA